MRTFRNVFRRKFRAFLTIFGITIGIFALVVMGSLAEKITLMVNGGTRFYADKVTLSQGANGGFSSSPISVDTIPRIQALDGVQLASASVGFTLNKDQGASFGMPDLVEGNDLRGRDLESFKLTYAQGRELEPTDEDKAVVGADMVKKLNARIGGTINVRGRDFTVVGILDKTLTVPDTTVDIPFKDAQSIFYNDLPDLVKSHLDPSKLATTLTIYPKPGVDPNQLAKEISDKYPEYNVIGPAKFQEQVTNSTRIFTAIVFGVALISLLVGGLSVINTMTMSVFERTREVGIRKSLGASDGRIVRQFLAESALIGALGGVTGLVLGWLLVMAANAAGASSGIQIFLLTPRLAVGSVGFAVLLGVVSGLYPSWHAARLNPVTALRYE